MEEDRGQRTEGGEWDVSERKTRKGHSEQMMFERRCESNSCKVIHEERKF